ncbi:MAG: LamG domain-containing protein, partial [Candidatus Roizmanbacteria bacterium]
NQFKASGYLDTGKLGQAVSIYGKSDGSAGNGSTITFNRGAQISGNNYEHINNNQGSVSFWFKPNWSGNPAVNRWLFRQPGLGGNIYIATGGSLYYFYWDASANQRIAFISGTSWSSATWYHVVARWNTSNPVNGSQYVDITLNGVSSSNGYTSPFTSGVPPAIVSICDLETSYSSSGACQGLVDDVAVFDRPLSAAEITSVYNAGTGNEAGYVADPSLKFYAKMDGTGTLQPVTYNVGASASKLTRASAELTGGTNLLTDGNMEDAGTTGWVVSGGSAAKESATTNVLFDTQVLKLTYAGSLQSYKAITGLSAGQNLHITAWVKADITGTNGFKVATNSASDAANLTYLTYLLPDTNWHYVDYSIKVLAGQSQIVIAAFSFSGGANIYLDNISVTPNLVDNGGMEGQYTATGTALYSATIAQARSGVGPYVYTEAGKFAAGLAGLVATDGTNFGYITTSDANSVTVDFTGGSGTIATNAVFDVKNGLATGWGWYAATTASRESTIVHSGSYSQKIVASGGSQGPISNSLVNMNIVAGNAYLVSAWVYLSSGAGLKLRTNQAYLPGSASTTTSGSWQKLSMVSIATTTSNAERILVFPTSGAATFYVDDISVTPLDNVALSLKAWTPVADSGGSSNSLSVQGSTTGVVSNATGIRNTAYTFDGSSGYVRQKTYAVNVGTLSYNTGAWNDTTAASFEDDGMDFSTYQTTSGNAAYMIVVTNSDNTTSWGYLGTASGAGNKDIPIYTTKAMATRGWASGNQGGILPIAGSKVPAGYEIRKTDFQIVGARTYGVWAKRAGNFGGGDYATIVGAINWTDGVGKGGISIDSSGNVVGHLTANISIGSYPSDTNWHYYTLVLNSGSHQFYVDGVLNGTNSTSGYSYAANENYLAFRVACSSSGASTSGSKSDISYRCFNGSIDEPFVTDVALTAAQIFDMYNNGR